MEAGLPIRCGSSCRRWTFLSRPPFWQMCCVIQNASDILGFDSRDPGFAIAGAIGNHEALGVVVPGEPRCGLDAVVVEEERPGYAPKEVGPIEPDEPVETVPSFPDRRIPYEGEPPAVKFYRLAAAIEVLRRDRRRDVDNRPSLFVHHESWVAIAKETKLIARRSRYPALRILPVVRQEHAQVREPAGIGKAAGDARQNLSAPAIHPGTGGGTPQCAPPREQARFIEAGGKGSMGLRKVRGRQDLLASLDIQTCVQGQQKMSYPVLRHFLVPILARPNRGLYHHDPFAQSRDGRVQRAKAGWSRKSEGTCGKARHDSARSPAIETQIPAREITGIRREVSV